MSRKAVAIAPLLLVAVLANGCAMGEEPFEALLVVFNWSQFSLHEIRIHPEPEYLAYPNMLEKDLAVESSASFYENAGYWYVTVIRDKGQYLERIAFTTERPLRLEGGKGYKLTVFDESFRIEDSEYVPPPDAGQ